MTKLVFQRVMLSVLVPVLLLPVAPALALSESAIRSRPVGAAVKPSRFRSGRV